jgi:multisubunit Na+/H+ antiporter MnhF subunit
MENKYILCEIERCINDAQMVEIKEILSNSINVEYVIIITILTMIGTYFVTKYFENKNKIKIKLK